MKFFRTMKPSVYLLSLALLPGWVAAQGFRLPGGQREDEIPLLTKEERQTVDQQRDEFAGAFGPALKEAAGSTVRIYYRNARGRDVKGANGTVIGDGTQILTKWSEVMDAVDDFRAGTIGSEVRPVKVTGVYPEEDLAVLTIEGAPLTPVKWVDAPLELGSFLVASQPDGRPAGYGVVSVLERSLRASDQGFLGVEADLKHTGGGVKVKAVTPDSGAEVAGLKAGDVVLKVGEREISGPTELQNALWGAKPGTKINIEIRRKGQEQTVEVTLGGRPETKQFAGDRLLQMERMGSDRLSRVREGFPKVVETDMVLKTEDVGGPVANLKGEVVGVTVSRAGRTRSYMMSSSAILEMLKKESMDPSLVKQEQRDKQLAARAKAREVQPRQMKPGEMEDLQQELQNRQRHQGDMTKLMDRIQSELDALERGE